ncbi:hypothetical protein [Paraburkholderia sp. BR14320]|uniref:hypothetical protein n=1 Tax=unclassified Paraburkholderia TaxID=2615204 RepID=UPI0034CF307B
MVGFLCVLLDIHAPGPVAAAATCFQVTGPLAKSSRARVAKGRKLHLRERLPINIPFDCRNAAREPKRPLFLVLLQ